MALADTIHTYSGYFGGLGFLEVMRPNTWLIYHIDMFINMFYSASLEPLHYPISVRAIDPVCPQAVLPMRVTLFPSGKLCVTNIPSINCKDTSFCSELNGEHAGASSMSLQFAVFEVSSNIF